MALTTDSDNSAQRFDHRYDAATASLAPARTAIETFARSCGFDEKAVADIGLCVNEAMANIIRHAYASQPGQSMQLTAEFSNDDLLLRLRDWGSGINPENMAKPRDPLRPGGLGLVCLKSLMDQIRFIPQEKGMLLEMIKKLHPHKVK